MKHNETLMISLEEIDWNYLIETVNEPPKNFKSDVYIVRARDKRRLQNDVLRKRLSEQNGINILIIFPFDGEQSGSSLWTTRERYLSKTHFAQWCNWEQDGRVFSLFFFFFPMYRIDIPTCSPDILYITFFIL